MRYLLSVLVKATLLVLWFNPTSASGSVETASRIPFFRGGVGEKTTEHDILSEKVLHDNWRRLISRKVRLPNGLIADFEIVSQKGTDQAVLVFVWDSLTKTATLLREYMPSTHTKMMGLAAGMVDSKHESDDPSLTAAQHELEEECRLTGGSSWIRLTESGVAMDKYSTTRLMVYLVLDPVDISAAHAKPRDETEQGMEVCPGVSVDEIREMLRTGQMTVTGSWACLLALEKLREIGEIQ